MEEGEACTVSGDRRSASERYRPLLDFMIVGTQKGGTNALYRFLREHPQIRHVVDQGGASLRRARVQG